MLSHRLLVATMMLACWLLRAGVLCLAHSKMKLCLFASYTYKRKSIRVFRTPILVYLDVRGVEIPLLSTVSISNCRYQEAPLRSARPGVRGLFTRVKSPMNFKKILAFCSSWEILS